MIGHIVHGPNSGEVDRGRLVIVGCCKSKTITAVPVPALDLYLSGPVPTLRAHLGHQPDRRSRIRILSAEHGIVTADTPLLPYDRPLDPDRAAALRPVVAHAMRQEMDANGVPSEVLVVVEPLYLVLVADLLAVPGIRVRWVPDPVAGWPEAENILKEWKW
ncbi:DUF6884 domain-containing protein [Micromonospora sp. NPDC051925]|uniref:DUF6884 domain-containing protein n=1 Tax=Micromonospora sp. NPDC051925 TaxID=3364288 RepID=UPI0037C7F57C